MLSVLRRQAKVNRTQTKTFTDASTEPAAGPSKATTELNYNGSTTDRNERNKGKARAGTSSQSQGSKSTSSDYLKAKMNVIRTMILILVCFVICLFPVDFYFF